MRAPTWKVALAAECGTVRSTRRSLLILIQSRVVLVGLALAMTSIPAQAILVSYTGQLLHDRCEVEQDRSDQAQIDYGQCVGFIQAVLQAFYIREPQGIDLLAKCPSLTEAQIIEKVRRLLRDSVSAKEDTAVVAVNRAIQAYFGHCFTR